MFSVKARELRGGQKVFSVKARELRGSARGFSAKAAALPGVLPVNALTRRWFGA